MPLIGAALGLVQQNKDDQERRKQQMEAAAMGKFAESAPPGGGAGKTGALLGIGKAIGGMTGGDPAAASVPLGADGSQQLMPQTDALLGNALQSLDASKRGSAVLPDDADADADDRLRFR